ncbi:MAG: phenylalanine--tRNA ligase subunit alpha [Candidatus Latescibacteria bacterium]|nr:phenylalanine--tRNA ligase subunit alpha [Candidatus Latescibacterota bacterium]
MLEQIDLIVRTAAAEIAACRSCEALDALRVRYLGRKHGQIPEIFRSIGALSPQERPAAGQQASRARDEIERLLLEAEGRLEEGMEERAPPFDMTLPGRRPMVGRRHPLSLVIDEVVEIFRGMGFSVAEGPEVETEYYNFDALNTPADHPARDTHDTFYLPNGQLLRTHTSPVQIRVMEQTQPPVRIIALGRCYRRDTPDATHYFVFHQVEGLYVDRGVTFGDMKGVITVFVRQLLGAKVKVRFRPHFFPFTEPSAEYDFSCVFCDQGGCRTCKGTGWLEISGAGMVDPEVFGYVGYDPEIYTGFAFGMGVERIAMMKYRIDDIRVFYENDLRFIGQF